MLVVHHTQVKSKVNIRILFRSPHISLFFSDIWPSNKDNRYLWMLTTYMFVSFLSVIFEVSEEIYLN